MKNQRHRGVFPTHFFSQIERKDFSQGKETRAHQRSPEQGTPLCVSGSYTVEAAVVFPIFVGLCIAVLLLFRVLTIERKMATSLQEAVREIAVTNTVANAPSAILLAEKKIQENEVPTRYIKGGTLGISFLGSTVSDTEVHLLCTYYIPFPVNFFSKDGLCIQQEATERRWVGWNPNMEVEGESQEYVYITPRGEAYHRTRDCVYLKPSVRAISAVSLDSARNADGRRYGNCPYCKSASVIAGTYYVTEYGESYHVTTGCTGLKRTVQMETIWVAVERGYHSCPKCGGD